MKIHHIDGSVLFEAEANSVRELVEMAVSRNTDLAGANLREADLYLAKLDGANLRDANLYLANLAGANLCKADLSNANLSSTSLSGANLHNSNLSNANLCSSNLFNSKLSGADLSNVNLSNADLRGTYFRGTKNAPLLIYGFTWPVYISGFGDMRIGAQMAQYKQDHCL